MAFSGRQREIMGRHLRIRQFDDPRTEPTTTLTVSKRQLSLLLQALDHFRTTHCPMEDGPPGCAMLTWYEQPGTGSIAETCALPCDEWIEHLIGDLPRAFPADRATTHAWADDERSSAKQASAQQDAISST